MGVSANGTGWAVIVAQGVAIIALTGVLAWIAGESLENRDFRKSGERCTAQRCGEMDAQIQSMRHAIDALPPRWLREQVSEVRMEQKRLHQEIDRLNEEVWLGRRKPRLKPYVE